MNWNSPLGISLFFAFSTGVVSLSQAWVLGSPAPRWPRYLIAWLGSSMLLAWAGGMVLDVESGQGGARDDVRRALLISGLLITALAFWIGAVWGRARVQAENLLGRMRVLSGPHFAVVFFGSCAALLVIIFVGLSHMH